MSVSLPILFVSIGLLALGLGLARGAWLHSPDFVARGRKRVQTIPLPSPMRSAQAARVRARRRANRFGSGPRTPQTGLAR